MTTTLRGEKPGRQAQLQSNKDGMTYSVDRVYYVQSSVRNESELNVIATTGLPIIGISSLAGFPGTICRNLNPSQNSKQPHLWEVTANFSTQPIQQEAPNTGPGDTPNPDPTTWLPIYSGKMQYYPEVVYEDFSPSPGPYKWVNYAEVPFNEPLVITRPIIIFDFWQMEASSTTNKTIGDRNDCINSSSITLRGESFPQYTLKCSVIEFERGYLYGYSVVNIHYQLAYKPSKWTVKPLQVGYEYKPAAGADRTSSPKLVALNADGTKRSDSLAPLADKEFIPHKPISFSFLR
jgi:hypothetical protein